MRLLLAAILFLLPCPATFAQVPSGDHYAQKVRERAERKQFGGEPENGSVGAGNRLFHMIGGDNAECVRSIPDANGDGRDEIVVGIGQSGTDNLFCLDGASSGPATVVWQFQTNGGLSGGSCYGDQSIVPISDTEANGFSNVLIGTAWGGRTAYDLDTAMGSEAWRFDTYLTTASGWVYSLCEVSDVTGDGVPEYAFGVGSDSNAVYLVDGASSGQATVVWRYAAGDAVYSVRNLGDVNGDGTDDVLAAVGDDVDRVVCLEGDSPSIGGSVLWTYSPGVSVYAVGVQADITGDGIDEALAVLWTLGGSAVRCLDGSTGSVVWSSTSVGGFGMQARPLDDVTGDGIDEVVVSSWENAVIVLDGSTGALVWKTSVGTQNGGDVWTARGIDDLNGDGRQDVVAGSFDGHVYAMDGDDGRVFWAFDTNNRVFSVAPVGDLNGDQRPEVVAGTQDTTNQVVVHVLEGDADIPFPGVTFTGTATPGGPYTFEITGTAGSFALPFFGATPGSFTVSPFAGTLGITPPLSFLSLGTIPVVGAYTLSGVFPPNPSLVGNTFYVQGIVFDFPPLNGSFTGNVETLLFQ